MSYKKTSNESKKFNFKLVGLIVILVLVASGSIYAIGLGVGWWGAPIPDDTTPVTTPSEATFNLECLDIDGYEDVSEWVKISIWIPEDETDMEYEDYFKIANFEEKISSDNAEDVSLDISGYKFVWLETDPDDESLFATHWYLLSGHNADYQLEVLDLTTDVNFNLFDRDTLDEINVTDFQTNGNNTLIFDCPHDTRTALQLHANTNDWVMDTHKWADLDESDRLDYYNEKYFGGQYPIYVLTDDAEQEYDDPLEQLTNAFAFKVIFNTTVSTTDGSGTQVNCTITDPSEDIEVIIDGVNIWFVFYEAVTFVNGVQTFDFSIQFGENITLSDIDSGRLDVPRADDNLGAFVKYSDIAT